MTQLVGLVYVLITYYFGSLGRLSRALATSSINVFAPAWRPSVEPRRHPLPGHRDLRHFLYRRRPLAQQQGKAQAADHPGLRLPDGGADRAIAGRPGPRSAVLLRPYAAVPDRRGGVRS